jgi:uncharacterized membrane protein YhaH (DUF805 family)
MHNPYAAPQAALALPALPAYEARLFGWNGRIGRLRFVAYTLAGLTFALCFGLLAGMLIYSYEWQASEALKGSAGLLMLSMPVLALIIAMRRRLHDLDVSSWWGLFLLFPILQFIFLIYLLVAPGKPEDNRFGPAPPVNTAGVKGGVFMSCLVVAAVIALRSP